MLWGTLVLDMEGYVKIRQWFAIEVALILTRKNLFSVYFNKPVTLLFSFWLKSDDHDGSEIEKIKQEITQLRNSVFEGIYHEQEEYVSIWFFEMFN